MKIVHPDIVIPLVEEHSLTNETIIENPSFFSDLLLDLCHQLAGGDGRIVFSKKSVPCSTKTICFVENLHRLSVNTTPILKKAFSKIENDIIQMADLDPLFRIFRNLYSTLLELGIGNLEPSVIEDVKIPDILSAFGMHFPMDELSIAERLVEYLNIHHELFGDDLFIILHLRSYLSPEETSRFIQQAKYAQMQLWIIGSQAVLTSPERPEHHRIIIDNDLSVI